MIDQTQPWARAKAGAADLPHLLWCLASSLSVIARLVAPVMPTTAKYIRERIEHDPNTQLTWPEVIEGRVLPSAPKLVRTGAPDQPLFPRLDDAAQPKIF